MADGGGPLEGLSACECPVCFQILSETRLPMSMPCGHTLCQQCIEALLGVSKPTSRCATPTFRCPICREWINKESVSLNVTLRDLIGELARLKLPSSSSSSSSGSSRTALYVSYEELQLGPALDRGAFGVVCRAQWKGDDVAVKLFSTGEMSPTSMEAFRREVFVMNCLRHPNVVLLMGACQTPPKLAIIMEFVAGGSLHKVLHVDGIEMGQDVACSVGRDVCRGLQYLHSINILHRDLKSKNVLLTAPPPAACQAKLCDFGLARMRLESATMTGNIGTVHWSAPEVLNSARYQFPADVYSFGMVLYEMATGTVPFGAMLPVAVMMAVAIRRVKPPLVKPVNPMLAQLIYNCIEWEAGARPSVAQVISELTKLLPPPTTPTDAPSTNDPHAHSLGVVFVSVTDSEDFVDQDLTELAHNMGILAPHTNTTSGDQEQNEDEEDGYMHTDLFQRDQTRQSNIAAKGTQPEADLFFPPLNPSNLDLHLREGTSADHELAQRLREDERSQLEYDAQLAAQLQMRENAYLRPFDEVPLTVNPPAQVLQSIESLQGRLPVTAEAKRALLHKQQAPAPAKHNVVSYQNVQQSYKGPTKQKRSKHQSAFPPLPPPSSAPPPPPPPAIKAVQQTTKGKSSNHSRKQKLLSQVRTLGASVARRLKPVDTVEKRAFRVGRVVDGYDSTLAQHTFQNLLRSFNRKWLSRVEPRVPRSPYPLGRVLVPQSVKVKRMSSLLESPPVDVNPAPKPLPPARRLHPAIRSAIERYPPKDKMHHVVPVVKDMLPTLEVIEQEKADLDVQRDAAATRIQAAWRDWHAQHTTSPNHHHQQQQQQTALEVWNQVSAEDEEEENGGERENHAATRIQAAWRAWAARKAYLHYLDTYKKLQTMRTWQGGNKPQLKTKGSKPQQPLQVVKSKSHPPAHAKKSTEDLPSPPRPGKKFSSSQGFAKQPRKKVSSGDAIPPVPIKKLTTTTTTSTSKEKHRKSPKKITSWSLPPNKTFSSSSDIKQMALLAIEEDLPAQSSNEGQLLSELVAGIDIEQGFHTRQPQMSMVSGEDDFKFPEPQLKKTTSVPQPRAKKFAGPKSKVESTSAPRHTKITSLPSKVVKFTSDEYSKITGKSSASKEPNPAPQKYVRAKSLAQPSVAPRVTKPGSKSSVLSTEEVSPLEDMQFNNSGVKTVSFGGDVKSAPPQQHEEERTTKSWFGGHTKSVAAIDKPTSSSPMAKKKKSSKKK